MPLASLDVEAVVSAWPEAAAIESEIASLFTIEELAAKAREESLGKHPTRERLRRELETLKTAWPELCRRLRTQLVPFQELQDRLTAVGAPYASEQIGISSERLEASYRKAYHIRRRFTILDLARRTGMFEDALQTIFAKPESTDQNSKCVI